MLMIEAARSLGLAARFLTKSDGGKIYVNFDYVSRFFVVEDGRTRLTFADGDDEIDVQEDVDFIHNKLGS
jgi:hypothetical protein